MSATGRPSIDSLLKRGLLVLDKPPGPTSHEAALWAREILGVPKAGHVGTLDPRVTGVLPLWLDRGVGLAAATGDLEKEYVGLLRLHREVERRALDSVVQEFTGPIYQRPPLRSAVEKRVRVRTIHELQILEADGPLALFRVRCEAGTYIRKLVHDLGLALGTGAHMVQLRRTRAGPWDEARAVTLHRLKEAADAREAGDPESLRALLQSPEEALGFLPRIVAKESAVEALCHGAPLMAPGLAEPPPPGLRPESRVAVLTPKGELVCVGEAAVDSERMGDMASGVAVKPWKVVMEPGTYPRGWKRRGESVREG
ncbi:MAG: RNA-guided pseudouridylation complex pseudouridine synthase subunit Cbf5 [Halobacteria archaeon]